MKAREGSRRFSDLKKRLAPGVVLRKFGWRRGVVCEKLCRRLQEFGKKLPGVQRVKQLVPRFEDFSIAKQWIKISKTILNVQVPDRTLSRLQRMHACVTFIWLITADR